MNPNEMIEGTEQYVLLDRVMRLFERLKNVSTEWSEHYKKNPDPTKIFWEIRGTGNTAFYTLMIGNNGASFPINILHITGNESGQSTEYYGFRDNFAFTYRKNSCKRFIFSNRSGHSHEVLDIPHINEYSDEMLFQLSLIDQDELEWVKLLFSTANFMNFPDYCWDMNTIVKMEEFLDEHYTSN